MEKYLTKATQVTESEICTALRFPLMCGIVFIHAQFTDSDLLITSSAESVSKLPLIYDNLSIYISKIICAICVPAFYFISGFLFFYKSEASIDNYKRKLKKRFHSLLLPYVFWNGIILAFYLFAQYLIPSLVSERSVPISQYSFTDIIWAFWDVSHVNHSGAPFPIAAQFWFIRNLMVTVILAPFIFLLIKKCVNIYIPIFCILWIFGFWPNIPGFGIGAFFFFSMGAYYSIHDKSFVRAFRKYNSLILLIYFILSIVLLVCWDLQWSHYLLKICIILGIPAFIGLLSKARNVLNYFLKNKILSNSSFFLFAYHFLPLVLIIRYLLRTIAFHNNITYLLIYFIPAICIIYFGVELYRLLYKYLPKFTSFITGGR